MLAGIVVIKPAREPVAFVDREIKFELVTRAPRWIRPRRVRDERLVGTKVETVLPGRHDTRRAIEELCKLAERDRSPPVEAADRMTVTQQPRGWGRIRSHARERRQVDQLSRPRTSHRRRRRCDSRIR